MGPEREEKRILPVALVRSICSSPLVFELLNAERLHRGLDRRYANRTYKGIWWSGPVWEARVACAVQKFTDSDKEVALVRAALAAIPPYQDLLAALENLLETVLVENSATMSAVEEATDQLLQPCWDILDRHGPRLGFAGCEVLGARVWLNVRRRGDDEPEKVIVPT